MSEVRSLNLAGAERLIAAAFYAAQRQDAAVCVAVVDVSGQLLSFKRMDRCALVSIDVALGKARTAAYLQKPAKVFEEMIDSGKVSMLSVPGATPLSGGIPVHADSVFIGAVGVSGSTGETDEWIAQTAVDMFGDKKNEQ